MQLEAQFDEAMMGIYDKALAEAGYKATIFFRMLNDHRGLETARRLIHSPKVSVGYTSLWERGRLDLTVEALIVEASQWHELFTEDEIEICRRRLKEYKYVPKS